MKAEVRKGTRFCSASCRAASWRGRENAEHVGKILAGLNQERAAAQLAPFVRDAAQDALAAQGATLRGGWPRPPADQPLRAAALWVSSEIGPMTDPARPQDGGAIWWRALCLLDCPMD